MFAEMLTKALLAADKRDAPSSHTVEAVEWACKGGPDLQKGCLWAVYFYYCSSPSEFFFSGRDWGVGDMVVVVVVGREAFFLWRLGGQSTWS